MFGELHSQIFGLTCEPQRIDHVRFTIPLKRAGGVKLWGEFDIGFVNDRSIGGAFINSSQRSAYIDHGDNAARKFGPEPSAFERRFSVDAGGHVVRIRQRQPPHVPESHR